MSSTVPKSESATSLLKSSAASGRSAHHPENAASSRRNQHSPAAQRGGRAAEETCWLDDCEASARRPLCHPKLVDNRNSGDRRRSKGQSRQAHAPLAHGYSQEELVEIQEVGRDEIVRSKSSRHPHPQHKPSRRDLPLVHGRNARPARAPSLSMPIDEAAFFFEFKDRTRTGSSLSLASDPPASSSPLPAASKRSSGSHGRSSGASSELDSSLHPIVKSVFGQVQPYVRVEL
ncbi:hypothetical protein AAFF_G00031320 [Aldrovandia affinis]|uniref:Uncharacterized protein n=1 Tax=Aldrovandia affinis TaxID=143900 RepID=A0AAD7WFY2_9TELE|nr:hypothetical protein AAFF_G00031320 [Aldrovandia affinis]